MHWILQENLFRENEWDNLVSTLTRFDIPFSVHKVIPFIGELLPAPEPKHEHVVCFGSYSMRHTAKKMGWTPGVFDLFDQNFSVQMQHWGDMMLNADSQIVKFKDAHLDEMAFVRPIDDSKYFAGKVFEPEEFNDWVHKVAVLNEDYGDSLTGETLIQICKPKKIYTEYRFWIVDGQVITSSLYKRGDRVVYDNHVDAHVGKFVEHVLSTKDQRQGNTMCMIPDGWMPARAFVLDVCETPEGMKIVEINTINSAGFYAANVTDLVLAIDNMRFA